MIAISIFVKTPSFSPVKTRLASGIGEERALEFYSLALKVTEETVSGVGAKPYWAVGEQDGLNDPFWSVFETVWTGEGDLGARQHHVYETLLQKHERVILIGADAPQISQTYIEDAISKLDNHDFVIGPANDGGYVLFGGRVPVAKEVWVSVTWSSDNTRREFENSLPSKPFELAALTDVDGAQDLQAMIAEMPNEPTVLQRKLIDWVSR